MQEVGDLQQGRLRIACLPAASNHMIPRLVSVVHDKPKVSVALMMRSSATIEEWIASQQYDIGLAETPLPNRALEQTNFRMQCVCAIPEHDPLAALAVIEPRHLSGQPLATLQEEHPTCIATRQAFRQQKARYIPRFELHTFQPALELVEQGLCYTISEPFSVQNYQALKGDGSKLVFRPFRPDVNFAVSILQPAHRPASLLASAFRDMLVEAIEALQQQFQP
ncbi:MAG: LysR substrate-binding domain-containing protein [Marinobacterium sp.]|nr:LysR substrate-binding domain-containing protein [Marinobacterium sp.]